MTWYVVYTKRRQERRALINMERQGVTCYLPMIRVRRIMRGTSHAPLEPLFPRYLFIRFEAAGTGWSALRSTRGVSRLVSFGIEPAQVDDGLIEHLRATEKSLTEQPLFAVGEPVQVILGPFAGIEGVYLMADGESRAMVLVELLSKSAKLPVPLAYLKRVDG